MNIIAIVSAKGGVGKTTFSAGLGIGLARSGVQTVAIDLDPQDALGLHYGHYESSDRGLAQACLNGVDWRSSLLNINQNCTLLPYGRVQESTREAFEQLLRDRPTLLRDHILSLNLPDDAVVILDTPPGPSVYLTQALSACNTAVIVVLADAASYATLPMMAGLLQRYCLNRPGFSDYSYLINQVDQSRQLNSDVAHVMRMQFGARALTLVHQDQAIPEALACNQFVGDYDPMSRAASDLSAVCQQLMGVPVDSGNLR